MRFFRRKSKQAVVQSTFHERIQTFWDWWRENHKRVYGSVEMSGGATIQPELSQQVGSITGEFFPWTLGPGDDGEGHAFILSPEGDPILKILSPVVIAQAPELEGWTWRSSKPADPLFASSTIAVDRGSLSAEEIWVTPTAEEEHEHFNLTVWSPLFDKMPRDAVNRIIVLFIDKAFGEELGETVIGNVQIGEGKLADSMPFTELPQHIEQEQAKLGWTPRVVISMSYNLEEPLGDFPRGDTFSGTTELPGLVMGYLKREGPLEHPLPKAGLRLVFLRTPRPPMPEGVLDMDLLLDQRYHLLDVLGEELGHHGRTIGCAGGRDDLDYIDLMLFDGERSEAKVAEIMDRTGIEWELLPFTR